jgi:hypothetical protein
LAEEPLLNIPESSAGCGQPPCGPPHGLAPLPPSPRPPVSLDQLQATQKELMRMIMENDACHGE